MFDSIFYWLGTAYRGELYISGLRIAGILCSYADILVAAMLLRVMDVIRKRPPAKFRYGILAVFAILTPALLLPKKTLYFFIAQFIVLGPPYLVLMYSAFAEAKYFIAYVKDKLSGSRVHGEEST